jgi:hypothetical protein
MAISTVVRYEHNRPPSGKVLVKLEQVARDAGLQEYADVFRGALRDELGASLPAAVEPPLDCATEEERDYVSALLILLRHAPESNGAKAVKKVLSPNVQAARQLRDATEALGESQRAIVRLFKAGRTVEEVGRLFKAEHIADALFDKGDRVLVDKEAGKVLALLLSERWGIERIAERWFNSDEDEVLNLAADNGLNEVVAAYESRRSESE